MISLPAVGHKRGKRLGPQVAEVESRRSYLYSRDARNESQAQMNPSESEGREDYEGGWLPQVIKDNVTASSLM